MNGALFLLVQQLILLNRKTKMKNDELYEDAALIQR